MYNSMIYLLYPMTHVGIKMSGKYYKYIRVYNMINYSNIISKVRIFLYIPLSMTSN